MSLWQRQHGMFCIWSLGGKSLWDVLSGDAKDGMGCFVRLSCTQYRFSFPPKTRAFPAILGKGPWPLWVKIIYLTSKLGEINNIEHKKGSKIYPQNQVILDCIMPSIPLKYKGLSIILIGVIVSHK